MTKQEKLNKAREILIEVCTESYKAAKKQDRRVWVGHKAIETTVDNALKSVIEFADWSAFGISEVTDEEK